MPPRPCLPDGLAALHGYDDSLVVDGTARTYCSTDQDEIVVQVAAPSGGLPGSLHPVPHLSAQEFAALGVCPTCERDGWPQQTGGHSLRDRARAVFVSASQGHGPVGGQAT